MKLMSRSVVAACCWIAASSATHAADNLLVAEPNHTVGYLPLYVAMRQGYLAKRGIEVSLATLGGGAGPTNAVLSGQAFGFIGGPEHDAFVKLKGGDMKAVVNVVNRGNTYFVAKKGMSPKPGESMHDYLKGKAIAVTAYGGTPNSITRYMIAKAGLTLSDVTIKEATNDGVVAAVKVGAAQIGSMNEPLLRKGIAEGIWDEPFYNVPKELGPYAYSVINIAGSQIRDNPERVKGFVLAMVEGLKDVYAHPDIALQIARKEFPTMAEEDLKATFDRAFADQIWSEDGMITPESWTTAESVVLQAGLLKSPVAYEDIFDMQYVPKSDK